MTRVGIMSMQRIRNYGSSLQAYGLRRVVEGTVRGADVSFVDYRPGPPLIRTAVKPSRAGRALDKLREASAVDTRLSDRLRFINHKRRYAARYWPLVGISPQPDHDLALDVQIIGSDEVFNCVQSNTNVGYARDLFGHDSPASRVISYAASFGNTTLERIDQHGIRDELVEDLSRMDAISVRDCNSADIIEQLIGTRPPIHVDPVLAYDFLARETRIPHRRLHPGKYVIVYAYPGRISPEENIALKEYARRESVDVLSFGGVQAGAERFIDCSPFELLAYFRDASAVVTDTFHGTIFSIITGTPFATLVRETVGDGYGNAEKLGYLLDTFSLGTRRLTDLGDLDRIVATPLDTAAIADVLAHERARTESYLRGNLR